jgi:hypothetical protein
MPTRCLYVYLDEAGNFDFSPAGTRYFILGSIALERPFGFFAPLAELRLDLLEQRLDIECFHASENKQSTRNGVFSVIREHLDGIRIDATIIEKRKTEPAMRADDQFYPKMLAYHLRYLLDSVRIADYAQIVIVTDTLPIQRKRKAIEKAVKQTLSSMLPDNVPYQVLHHDTRSALGLQVADYCTWAIYRKWDGADERSYSAIAPAIRSEFDIFRTGARLYY